MPPTTAEVLDENSFFIGTIFDVSNKVKNSNQQNTITKVANVQFSVTLNTNGTNFCHKFHSGAQVNVIPVNQIETLQTKSIITISNHPKHIQQKQYTSKRRMYFRYPTS